MKSILSVMFDGIKFASISLVIAIALLVYIAVMFGLPMIPFVLAIDHGQSWFWAIPFYAVWFLFLGLHDKIKFG